MSTTTTTDTTTTTTNNNPTTTTKGKPRKASSRSKQPVATHSIVESLPSFIQQSAVIAERGVKQQRAKAFADEVLQATSLPQRLAVLQKYAVVSPLVPEKGSSPDRPLFSGNTAIVRPGFDDITGLIRDFASEYLTSVETNYIAKLTGMAKPDVSNPADVAALNVAKKGNAKRVVAPPKSSSRLGLTVKEQWLF